MYVHIFWLQMSSIKSTDITSYTFNTAALDGTNAELQN